MPRRRRIIEEEIEEDEDIEEEDEKEWSIKRIFIGLVVVTMLGLFLYAASDVVLEPFKKGAEVLSASTKAPDDIDPEDVKLPSVNDVGGVLESARKTLTNINKTPLVHINPPSIISSQSGVMKTVKTVGNVKNSFEQIKGFYCQYFCKQKTSE